MRSPLSSTRCGYSPLICIKKASGWRKRLAQNNAQAREIELAARTRAVLILCLKLVSDPDQIHQCLSLQLVHKVPAVNFYREFADPKFCGNLFVRLAINDFPHNRSFASSLISEPSTWAFRLTVPTGIALHHLKRPAYMWCQVNFVDHQQI